MTGWRRFLGPLQTPRSRARRLAPTTTTTTTIATARHLVGGQVSDRYFWIGLPGGDPSDWYNWSDMSAHRGQVRYGYDGISYGEESLIGHGRRFFSRILEIMPPGTLQELWFGPQFPNLGRMFRIQVYRPADLDRAIETAKVAARAIFGDEIKFVEVAPMS
jgi:hypothetical protein